MLASYYWSACVCVCVCVWVCVGWGLMRRWWLASLSGAGPGGVQRAAAPAARRPTPPLCNAPRRATTTTTKKRRQQWPCFIDDNRIDGAATTGRRGSATGFSGLRQSVDGSGRRWTRRPTRLGHTWAAALVICKSARATVAFSLDRSGVFYARHSIDFCRFALHRVETQPKPTSTK